MVPSGLQAKLETPRWCATKRRPAALRVTFHTVMEGVREDYAEEAFYKDELDEDRAS